MQTSEVCTTETRLPASVLALADTKLPRVSASNTVDELKAECERRGLRFGGSKKELVERLGIETILVSATHEYKVATAVTELIRYEESAKELSMVRSCAKCWRVVRCLLGTNWAGFVRTLCVGDMGVLCTHACVQLHVLQDVKEYMKRERETEDEKKRVKAAERKASQDAKLREEARRSRRQEEVSSQRALHSERSAVHECLMAWTVSLKFHGEPRSEQSTCSRCGSESCVLTCEMHDTDYCQDCIDKAVRMEERNAEKQRQRGAHTTDVGRSIHSCPVARTADLEFFGTARDSTELTCDLCKTRGVMMYERS